jgi:hypothetical protein
MWSTLPAFTINPLGFLDCIILSDLPDEAIKEGRISDKIRHLIRPFVGVFLFSASVVISFTGK